MKRKLMTVAIVVLALGALAILILANIRGDKGPPPATSQVIVTTGGNVVVQPANDGLSATPRVTWRASANAPGVSTPALSTNAATPPPK